MRDFTIAGAQVILADDIVETTVRVEDGVITEVGGQAGDAIDGTGHVLAPAMIDVHGDAFERQIMPRDNVFFPLDAAILETDRQLAANGIATAFHAVTFSWEPGIRSHESGRDFMDALHDIAPRLTVDNRVQIRWETFALDAVNTIEAALKHPQTPALAFNDHTSSGLRAFDVSEQDCLFQLDPNYALADWDDPRLPGRHQKYASRAGMTTEAYLSRMKEVWARRGEIDGWIKHLAGIARDVGAPMLSHDDTQVKARTYFRNLGARVAEFPMAMPPALDARAKGDSIIFGAPNVMRGGSHKGSLAAADMIEDGLCDVLASDYYYPALLSAVARLDRERRAARGDIWSLVSSGPAKAMHLNDRGAIAVGKRADLVLVDWPEAGPPAVRATYCAGRQAYASQPLVFEPE